MVPKEKHSAMALLQEDISLQENPANAIGPRRSSRKVQQKKNGAGVNPKAQDGDTEFSVSPPGEFGDVGDGKESGEKGSVELAINSLRDMENSLRRAAKRQKLAIESSHVMTSISEDQMIPIGDMNSAPEIIPARNKKKKKKVQLVKEESNPQDEDDAKHVPGEDPDPEEADRGNREEADDADVHALRRDGARPPPVNSDRLPLPWKGRLGYACLNTYLRLAAPPVFSSRTCRIASIVEHRHPLQDRAQPEHPTKNRPDRSKPADVELGRRYVEEIALSNARDITKMVRWNEKYGIKFMRLSSEMFPFASHQEYGYKLAPFASEVLAEAGRVAAQYGHRLTTHPGQYTQLGSPRKEVVQNAIRDLEYHDEMLSLLRLPEQQNRDAIMILHMGGVFGDKGATLDRFRQNYAKLSPSIKARLVLENDDVSWSVHDLLPICEELNIPLVLDFHHHNIVFDSNEVREGTQDIIALYPRIKATWDRKKITQKMHYSEPCADAVTGRQRRKHSARVATLPPCANDMDLMIEAKDKEQAVFELMRNFKLPGWDRFNTVVPYERKDENRKTPKISRKKKKAPNGKEEDTEKLEIKLDEEAQETKIPDEEIGMGGPENRVYWPPGMEDWLRPKKKETKDQRQKLEADEDSLVSSAQ